MTRRSAFHRYLHRRILSLALPNILSNVTIPLLGLIDLALAGHLHDISSIGGVALGSTIFNLIYWNFGFLRMGTTGLTAQAHGEKDSLQMGTRLCQSLGLALVLSILLLLLRDPLGRIALMILRPDATLSQYAMGYYHLVIWGAPAVLMTYALNGFTIGMQNTLWPMIVSLVTNLLNISLSAYFVLWKGLEIRGLAMGTLLSQWFGCILLATGVWFLFLRTHKARLAKDLHTLLRGARVLFSTNGALFLRTLLLVVVTTFFTYCGTQMGATTLAANALLLQLFTFFSYFTDGFAYAAEALAGHYYGARNYRSLRTLIRLLFLWGAGLAVAITLVYLFGGSRILTLLTDKEEVIVCAHSYLIYIYILPLLAFGAFLWDGIYIGLGAARTMLWTMLLSVFVFFGLYFGLSLPEANDTLWIAFLSYLFTRSLSQTVASIRMPPLRTRTLHTYYLSIGSTHLDDERLLREALLRQWPDIELSSFYRTPDSSSPAGSLYLNSVGRLQSSLSPVDLQLLGKELEREMGRDRAPRGDIPMDIDVVMRGVEVLRPKDFIREYFRRGYTELLTKK